MWSSGVEPGGKLECGAMEVHAGGQVTSGTGSGKEGGQWAMVAAHPSGAGVSERRSKIAWWGGLSPERVPEGALSWWDGVMRCGGVPG